MKLYMESTSPERQMVEARPVADHLPSDERRTQIRWLDLALRDPAANSSEASYDNAACDAETSFSDSKLDHETKCSALDLDKGERIEMSPTGSDQHLIEDEQLEVKGELKEMSPPRSSGSRSVQFHQQPNGTPKSLNRNEADKAHTSIEDTLIPQVLLHRKSIENKSFKNDWETESGTNGRNGMASCSLGADEPSCTYLDNNSNVKEAKETRKDGATKSDGKTEAGYRVSPLRRILRHFSERRESYAVQPERRYFNASSASNLQPSTLLPSPLAPRRQSEGDAHTECAAWPRKSNPQQVNGVSGIDSKRWWEMDDIGRTNGYLEAGTITPRRSSITITTYFGAVEDGRTKTDGWTNGHLDPIPSISRYIGGDDAARQVVDGSTVIQIGGNGSIETSATVGEEQPVMAEDTGESFFKILLETVFPFIMAGFGCAFAGIVLDLVQHWQVFLEIEELFILVPSLLGLKGNLEMTQASRLSTQANLGHMETTKEQLKLIGASLALTQAQSIVVAFMASIVAILLRWIPAGKFDLLHGILVCTSSVITASIASFVLGSVMVGVVLISRKFHINPDNVATPFGGSLGDLTTIALLSSVAMLLFTIMDSHVWVAPVLLCFWLSLTPVWWTIANRHSYTRNVLRTGWVPVIGAMAISSVGGLVLDMAVEHFEGIAVFQPVVNGVGGNLVAVQASRLATALHRISVPGVLPVNAVRCCPNVFTTFFGKGTGSKTARVLMLMVIPGHIVFMFTIEYLKNGCSTLTPTFVVVYITATVIQVATLLYVANFIVHWLWSRGNDPDNYSIPYLTAIGDLLGGLLLVAAFSLLTAIGDINTEPKSG